MAAEVDSFKSEEIMASDLEILASNLHEEFRIEPVEITEEEFDKRHIGQAKIKKWIDPFFRDYFWERICGSRRDYYDILFSVYR